MVAIRDLKCSMDIAEMAALGKFEEEFIVYGCCYMEYGKKMYRVSTQVLDIYRFRERCLERGIQPGPVVSLLNRVLVPSGMQDSYLLQTKIQLAKKMQGMYSQEFLQKLTELAACENHDGAADIFYELQQKMIGCFDRETIQLVEGLMIYAKKKKKLKWATYQELRRWVNYLYSQMEDDVVIKKNFQRTFFGLAYYNGQQKLCYYVNAQESDVYKKRETLMGQGILTTPIVQKTYYYTQQPDLRAVKVSFKQQVAQWMDEEYWHYIERINQTTAAIPAEMHQELLREVEQTGTDAEKEYFQMYCCMWQLK